MTKATEQHLWQFGGTLLGWTLAQLYDKKDTVPFTLIGGSIGFIISKELFPDSPAHLRGLPRKRKRAKK